MSQLEPGLEPIERERILLESIKENPDLHHNALLKTIVPKYMAKNTFEKTRDSLLEKGVIAVLMKGNMKFYVPVSNYEAKAQQHFEKITHDSFHDLKISVKRLVTDYSHKDVDEKINLANSILGHLLQTDTGFTLLDSIKNPKKTLYIDEHLEIQHLIFEVIEIIHKDKDFESIYPTILSCMGKFLPKA
ncbi:hypothetical protein NsoK4_03525 [Nitrosopumilus sp. K4]|uniref:hypothetical protein n=1 Tax=Nitrosopumilus sp. K4 TaxID=2795383 RepID=UPI001BAD2F5E|nr:hypothetical protein [Nitrosopumilus sp. K4]QUC65661.1 hypothetical protein NsoK4_03525 [Nitrosopumilus sp. K4]